MALPTIAATATGSGSALTTGPLSSALAVVTGQVIVLLVAQTAAARDLTVTDDLGHTWTTQQTATNSRRAHIVTTVATTTGNMTITTGWSASATWQAEAFAINDADGGAAVDVSDQFTQTALSCFAAASTALDTSANVLVLAVYSCAVTRTWTKDAAYTLEGSGSGYLFQSLSSATALTDARSPATQGGGGAIASAAASIAIKGAAGGGNVTLTADAGAFTLSGQSANLLTSRVLPADAGAFVLAGQDANLLRSLVLTADAGTFTLAGQNAALTYSGTSGPFTLTAEAGAFTVAGQSADLLMSRVLTAEAGSFALAGQAAGLTYSGATTSETPTSVIRLVERSDTWRLPTTSDCWRLPARE